MTTILLPIFFPIGVSIFGERLKRLAVEARE
jgi:hypothetical protein